MAWDKKSKKRSKGRNFDAELKLLKYLDNYSTTLIPVEQIYEYGDNLANVDMLFKEELISREHHVEKDKKKVFCRISGKGHDFVRQEETAKQNRWIFRITIVTLVISSIALLYTSGILKPWINV